jgi:hypothetical protein
MAINQSQVDHIISSSSADDPDVKLQNLQDEVDLLKKSVKKLLIDLRERLNETENPFIVAATLQQAELPPVKNKEEEKKPLTEDREESQNKTTATERPSEETSAENQIQPYIPGQGKNNEYLTDRYPGNIQSKDALYLLKKQIEDIERSSKDIPEETKPADRPKLHKLNRLFEWVNRMVKKYGHDRLLIMIESYRTMGYVTEDACSQVKEISKLMPESIGDSHEISSEEFVSELYVLNRILSPEDSSLDREMIEVMMDKRNVHDKKTSKRQTSENTSEEDWINMLENV